MAVAWDVSTCDLRAILAEKRRKAGPPAVLLLSGLAAYRSGGRCCSGLSAGSCVLGCGCPRPLPALALVFCQALDAAGRRWRSWSGGRAGALHVRAWPSLRVAVNGATFATPAPLPGCHRYGYRSILLANWAVLASRLPAASRKC